MTPCPAILPPKIRNRDEKLRWLSDKHLLEMLQAKQKLVIAWLTETIELIKHRVDIDSTVIKILEQTVEFLKK